MWKALAEEQGRKVRKLRGGVCVNMRGIGVLLAQVYRGQ